MLSSIGKYEGYLERIDVTGQTETPDFSIDLAGQKVPLSTRFHAIVDGTTGDIVALSPPLIAEKPHVDRLIGTLAEAIKAEAA